MLQIRAFAYAPSVRTMYFQGLFWLVVVLVRPSLFIPVRFTAYLEASICFLSFHLSTSAPAAFSYLLHRT